MIGVIFDDRTDPCPKRRKCESRSADQDRRQQVGALTGRGLNESADQPRLLLGYIDRLRLTPPTVSELFLKTDPAGLVDQLQVVGSPN